jgi:probable phosphoglycerate mutase
MALERLILARHALAASNVGDTVSGVAPGVDLAPEGERQARALGEALREEAVELAVVTELRRTRRTAELALAGRNVPVVALPQLNEIRFGRFEGGSLAAYREWAWHSPPDALCPGGGESRAAAAARFADGLDWLLARSERVVLAVAHALPIRYVLDAVAGRPPAARVGAVPHAEPFRLDRAQVEGAATFLRAWSDAPAFSATMD